jgi:hypothetical protein
MSAIVLRYAILIVLLLLLQPSSAFSIISAEPSERLVRPGDTVRLLCVVDGHYEWCKFYHPSHAFCDFEWKLIKNKISTQQCALADRVGEWLFVLQPSYSIFR